MIMALSDSFTGYHPELTVSQMCCDVFPLDSTVTGAENANGSLASGVEAEVSAAGTIKIVRAIYRSGMIAPS